MLLVSLLDDNLLRFDSQGETKKACLTFDDRLGNDRGQTLTTAHAAW